MDGRTSGYDVEIAQTICERLVNGESLRAICADPAMPGRESAATGATGTTKARSCL